MKELEIGKISETRSSVGNTIYVWEVMLDRDRNTVEQLASLLQHDEWTRANQFKFAIHRNRYIVGRAVLRLLLGGVLNKPPALVRFRYTDRGKPELDETHGCRWHFNLSHSEGVALIGIARDRRIGIDVERIDLESRDLEDVARIFSDDEQAAIRELPESQRAEGFYRCWVRKEAFVKAQGLGITCELKDFSVTIAPHDARLLRAERSMAAQSGWRFAVLNRIDAHVTPYVAALVYEGTEAWVEMRAIPA
jgi:4'-phosphopantetheinyl transferase